MCVGGVGRVPAILSDIMPKSERKARVFIVIDVRTSTTRRLARAGRTQVANERADPTRNAYELSARTRRERTQVVPEAAAQHDVHEEREQRVEALTEVAHAGQYEEELSGDRVSREGARFEEHAGGETRREAQHEDADKREQRHE